MKIQILAAMGLFMAGCLPAADHVGPKEVADTRQAMRRQGFKTDLADFDFSVAPAMSDREDILRAAGVRRWPGQFAGRPDLLEMVGTNTAAVVWQLTNTIYTPPDAGYEMSWQEFRANIHSNEAQLDAASTVILSGPVRFNLIAARGSGMLLPHLATLKRLTEMFGSRTVLALRDGQLDAAWTNLMAATRLVTAWQIEPVQVSQMVRFDNTSLVFNALWQALQTNGWEDHRLAQLQSEWESVDFFTNLPRTIAFQRACEVASCEEERKMILASRPPFSEFFNEGAAKSPPPDPAELEALSRQLDYAENGSYQDEKTLLLFYRDRELEFRAAVKAPTWSAMRQLPGVTNAERFPSGHSSMLAARLNRQEMIFGIEGRGLGLLGRAATAEAQRRLIITALALQRYRGRHGSFPKDLSNLTPEYLAKPLPDFMDGRPLRYHLTDDGHFILYSVGLDGVDHGGRFDTGLRGDIIWPLPASAAAVEARRVAEREAQAQKAEQMEILQASAQWEHTARHQAGVEKLLAAGAPTNLPDPKYRGQRLSEIVRNPAVSGTNQPALAEMLTLKQVITGAEPETITFELPLSFDALNGLGHLCLFVDTNNDDSDSGCMAQQVDCVRATNGDCRLVWSTIYESPGKHALQAGLIVNDLPPDSPELGGPLLPFSISNLCQFSVASATFDPAAGATFRAKAPEKNCRYSVDLITTNGALLKTLTGSTSNGVIKVYWDLIDRHGARFAGDEFNSVFHLTLPDSGRSQTLKGP